MPPEQLGANRGVAEALKMLRPMGVNGASDRGGFFSGAVRQRTVSVLETWPRKGQEKAAPQFKIKI